MGRSKVVGFGLVALMLVGGAGLWAWRTLSGHGQLNVLLVVVDTLRADHLEAYGYARNTAPALAALADDSIVFEQTTSQAACTWPSVNSILTSRYPAEFMGQPGQFMGIPEATPTLASILREHGYTTEAFTSSPIVRDGPSKWNPRGGFATGFDQFDDSCFPGIARCITHRAWTFLSGAPRPFFLYLHYFDPHAVFDPPPPWESQFAAPYGSSRKFIKRGDPRPIERWLYSEGPFVKVEDRDIAHLVSLYDGEIAYFDHEFSQLLALLRDQELLDDTLIVVTSDHGEEFLEHQHMSHCRALYETLLHVPFVLHVPSGGPTGRVQQLAQNVDIVPTVLDYLGIRWEDEGLDGQSLRPAIERSEAVNTHAYAMQGVLRSVRDERYKLILDLRSDEVLLFDLQEDPGENTDLAAERPEVRDALRAELLRWVAEQEPDSDGDVLGSDLEERLRVLGYLE